MFLEIAHVGVAAQEPQQFIDDRLEVQLLGGKKRETLFEIEPHLMAEDTLGARTCAVGLGGSFGKDAVKQIEILFHILSIVGICSGRWVLLIRHSWG